MDRFSIVVIKYQMNDERPFASPHSFGGENCAGDFAASSERWSNHVGPQCSATFFFKHVYIYIIMYICTVFSVYFFVLFYPPIFKHGSSLVFFLLQSQLLRLTSRVFCWLNAGSNWHGFPHSSPFLVPSFLWIFPWFSYGFSMIIHVFPVEFPMAFLSWLVQLLRSARAERGCAS